jgi:hypothetical protein
MVRAACTSAADTQSASGSFVADMATKWQQQGELHAPIYGSNAFIFDGISISTGDVRETEMAVSVTNDPLVVLSFQVQSGRVQWHSLLTLIGG